MEVRSPENGFGEISDLLKDDESTLPEDLDLSFIICKDIAGGYVYNDSAGNDKLNFHLSEQGQFKLPSLPSNLGCYDIPGPCTENFHSSAQSGCHNDGLLDSNVVNDQKLHFEPQRNQYYEDVYKLCGDYLGDSTFPMDAESVDHEVLKDVCTQPQGYVSMQEHSLEGEIIDRPNTPPHSEIGEKNFLEELEQDLSQAKFTYNEEENEVSVDQICKLHSPSLHRGNPESKSENVNDLRNSQDASKEVEPAHIDQHDQGRTSQFSVSPFTIRESISPETYLCAHQLTDDHRRSASNGYNDISYSNASPDQIYSQAESCDKKEDTPSMDHSMHAGRRNCASSLGSGQRSPHMEGSPAKGFAPSRNPHRKRSRPQSPRQRNRSSRCKRDCSANSLARSPYSRESHKRSSEKAACFPVSPRSQNISVSQGHKELSHSSRSCRRKHDLARSSDRGREVTCQDHLLGSGCQKSSFPQDSREGFLNSSSSKCAPASPRNHHLHHNDWKVGRPISPSPVRQRDLCSLYKRGYNKSQSRSPYGRNRQSPRKRYSPRHRSPPGSYFARHRSPEIRYLSPASNRRTGVGKPGTCLFVAGFAFLTTERELERKFSQFGLVRNVRIIRDKRSGVSRGYGFLSLERDEEADAAIRALHRTEWNGRVILVEKSISN